VEGPCHNNSLVGNVVESNSSGIYSSAINHDNSMYLNDFMSNTQNVFGIPPPNAISPEQLTYTYNGSTYTNYLGNYWSDYTGTDNDGDGIGDTPYQGDNFDTRPLMQPMEYYEILPTPTPTPTPTPAPTPTPSPTPPPTPNTPVGSNVPVSLPCGIVTFSSVAAEGYTTCTSQQGNPAGGIPSGFRVRGFFIDITTTAFYSGPVTVCIPYDPSIPNPQNLKLFHWNGSRWKDVTTSVDPDTNTICGQDDSLSWWFIGDPSGGGGFPSGGGGCFIATAAYGTPMAEDIQVLRQFRDRYLITNPVGEKLVSTYYRVSPPMADYIVEHPSLKPLVRFALQPAIVFSSVAINTTPMEKIAIALVILTLLFGMRERKGQRKAT